MAKCAEGRRTGRTVTPTLSQREREFTQGLFGEGRWFEWEEG